MIRDDAKSLTANTIVPFLAEIFQQFGGEAYLGEPVTMAEHMLQAAHLAERAGEPEPVIVAALLHDIGHFTSAFGAFSMADTEDRYHDAAGARVAERFFPEVVTACIRHHVTAKRYLCTVDPAYLNRLSAASVHSLTLQGGPLDEKQAAAFARNPHLQEILRVRRYDDGGKTAGVKTPPFSYYAPMVRRLVRGHDGP